jgi:hypothetical protein
MAIGTLPLSTILSALAVTLLIFVSLGVAYLSTVEWRDRRRRASGPTGRA